jgi:2-phosphoglycerate kinase
MGAADPKTPGWSVLLLGGASGTGKTRVGYQLARRLGVGVTAVDDLVAVLERMTTPEQLPPLHFWNSHPDPGSLTATDIQKQGTHIVSVMRPALDAVIENHLEECTATVLEGDFIHPALTKQSTFGDQPNDGRVRAVFLLEDDRDQLVRNFADREPAFAPQTTRAEVSVLWSRWFSQQCQQQGVPAMPARPWNSLIERIITVSATAQR